MAFTYIKKVITANFRESDGRRIRHYRTDGAGELLDADLKIFLEALGCEYSVSVPYTPEHNSHAERVFRTLAEMTSSMLHGSGLPPSFWGYAYETAAYLKK